MATKLLTIKEVAGQMKYRGKPLTQQAVRYRIQKSNRTGANIMVQKFKVRGRMVDGLAQAEVTRLCKLWSNLHV